MLKNRMKIKVKIKDLFRNFDIRNYIFLLQLQLIFRNIRTMIFRITLFTASNIIPTPSDPTAKSSSGSIITATI